MNETIALQTALAAILCEAKALGVDVDAICSAAKGPSSFRVESNVQNIRS